MSVVFTLLILSFIGDLGARQPDILDINRIQLLPKGDSRYQTPSYHRRRSIISDQRNRRNDYGYHRGWFTELRPSVHVLHNTPQTTEKAKGKVHQPREDPRLFYQSDAYIKKNTGTNINNEVSSVYLGRGEVRGDSDNYRLVQNRHRDSELNDISEGLCIRCPHDRTLITKAGLDRALLQYPRLTTCTGRTPPRDTHFVHKYGPKFGSLLKEGSHMVIGYITHKDKILQTCKMQIHVLIQTCSVPKYLVPHCGDQNKTCSFTCRNPKAKISTHKTFTCREDMKWSAHLPTCSIRRSCAPLPPPEHGKLICHGITFRDDWRFIEGARCRLKCDEGWQWIPRAHSTCRRGVWTRELTCQPKRLNK